jgi:hypothetical protein
MNTVRGTTFGRFETALGDTVPFHLFEVFHHRSS